MKAITLSAKSRENSTKGRLSILRKSGRVPAIVYGLNKEPQTVDIAEKELKKCFKAINKNNVIQLNIEGNKESVIIKDMAKHPVKPNIILNLDFLRVDNTRPVKVKIPIKHSGVPIGVKNEGGQFSIMKRFVRVKCKVQDIPEAFEQDISNLNPSYPTI